MRHQCYLNVIYKLIKIFCDKTKTFIKQSVTIFYLYNILIQILYDLGHKKDLHGKNDPIMIIMNNLCIEHQCITLLWS